MPIYEYYCPDNHTVYQFYAKTLAQGRSIPPCPDNPRFRMRKLISSFSVTHSGVGPEPATPADGGAAGEDPKMEAALNAMEREFSHVDENDPRAMGRMMRRMAEMTGEKIEGEMEEMVRKLEEGTDPESLEAQFSDLEGDGDAAEAGAAAEGKTENERAPAERRRVRRRQAGPRRDPRLHDYP